MTRIPHVHSIYRRSHWLYVTRKMADRTICPHFLRGRCKFGDRCKFEHSHPRRQVCSYFMNGRCKFGDRCKFEHPSAPAAQNQPYVGETTHGQVHTPRMRVHTTLKSLSNPLQVLGGPKNTKETLTPGGGNPNLPA